jgi:hypothetical protein
MAVGRVGPDTKQVPRAASLVHRLRAGRPAGPEASPEGGVKIAGLYG